MRAEIMAVYFHTLAKNHVNVYNDSYRVEVQRCVV